MRISNKFHSTTQSTTQNGTLKNTLRSHLVQKIKSGRRGRIFILSSAEDEEVVTAAYFIKKLGAISDQRRLSNILVFYKSPFKLIITFHKSLK